MLDGRLRDAIKLEEELIPGHLVLPHGGRRERVRHRDRGQRPDAVRAEDSGQPGHRRAPVVPDDVRRRHVQSVKERGDVADHVPQPIGTNLSRALRAPEAAHVRRDDPVTAGRQDRNLVPPQPRRIRPAMQEYDRDAVAVFLDVEGNAVRLDKPAGVCARHDLAFAALAPAQQDKHRHDEDEQHGRTDVVDHAVRTSIAAA